MREVDAPSGLLSIWVETEDPCVLTNSKLEQLFTVPITNLELSQGPVLEIYLDIDYIPQGQTVTLTGVLKYEEFLKSTLEDWRKSGSTEEEIKKLEQNMNKYFAERLANTEVLIQIVDEEFLKNWQGEVIKSFTVNLADDGTFLTRIKMDVPPGEYAIIAKLYLEWVPWECKG